MGRLRVLLKLVQGRVIAPLFVGFRDVYKRIFAGSSGEAATDELPGGEIIADNIKAMQPVYFAAMLEELKAFQVVDVLVARFLQGLLPIGRGSGADVLSAYAQESGRRLSEAERRNVYARTLGIPGGAAAGMVNREFNELWLRFVFSVSSLVRQNSADDLLRAKPISQQQVKKTARDLAANLSRHGSGLVHAVATKLRKETADLITLVSDQEILSAYGARDMWQLIDQVAASELGGARNSSRYRTLATSGATIVAWLGKNTKRLSVSSPEALFNVKEIENPAAQPHGHGGAGEPTDCDLVSACEQWLEARKRDEARG